MNFDEALKNLRDNKVVTRSSWHGESLELKNDQFIVTTQKSPETISEQWNPKHDDLQANDWILIDPDDIKKFHLSINQLKSLGVNQEAIDELEKPDTLPTSTERTKELQGIVEKLFPDKKSLLKDTVDLSNLGIQNCMSTFKQPQFPEIARK